MNNNILTELAAAWERSAGALHHSSPRAEIYRRCAGELKAAMSISTDGMTAEQDDELLQVAERHIAQQVAERPDSAAVEGNAAAFLYDLYAVAMAHGVTPADLGYVVHFPQAVVDALLAGRRKQERRGGAR